MNASKFNKIAWISLVFVYLVIIAGGVVRMSGSGMGCPDWPKCFGTWIPPTNEDQLPENYREDYTKYRIAKIEKFTKFLSSIGLTKTANSIKNDPRTYELEAKFNASRTWTEYGNRLVGFIAGNLMLLQLILAFLWYRKKRRILLWLALANLIIIGVEGWFGSIVVASNLTPWIITVHMLLALVIIVIQLIIINKLNPKEIVLKQVQLVRWLLILGIGISLYQIFAGTQLRQGVDIMLENGASRSTLLEDLGMDFYLHRSFSWAVLVSTGALYWLMKDINELKWAVWLMCSVVFIEVVVGIILTYADMPKWAQPTHLVLACIMFAAQAYIYLQVFWPSKQVEKA